MQFTTKTELNAHAGSHVRTVSTQVTPHFLEHRRVEQGDRELGPSASHPVSQAAAARAANLRVLESRLDRSRDPLRLTHPSDDEEDKPSTSRKRNWRD